MKKYLMLIFILLFIVSSVFSQEETSEISIPGKVVLRPHVETIFISFSAIQPGGTYGNSSLDYSTTGLGLSASFLFGDHAGMTFVFGGLFLGVEDPFSAFSYIECRNGLYFKIGPYLRFGRVGISPLLDIVWVSDKDEYTNDWLIGLSCEIDIFVTSSVSVYFGGSILGGDRWSPRELNDLADLFIFFIPEHEGRLVGVSLTLGAGFAF